MKLIRATDITNAVHKLYDKICCELDTPLKQALIEAECSEKSALAKFALGIMNDNIAIAKKEHIAICQDTGMAVVFVEIGREVYVDNDIEAAINQGVRLAYDKHFRKSVLDPITRENTLDNTPAVIHYEIIEGDKLKISVMAKGFGSENMSRLYMLTPADGIDGIKNAVVETVVSSGGCACPPVIVGVGVGGTMEKCALLAKKALFREIGSLNINPNLALLEKELLDSINLTGVGAQGLGGDITALGVFIESYPTHIAGLPVAINIQCHVSRHGSVVLEGADL